MKSRNKLLLALFTAGIIMMLVSATINIGTGALSIEFTDPENSNPSPGTPYQPGNGSNFQVQAGNQYQIRTQSRFMLNVTANQTVEMNMTEYCQYEDAPQTTTRTMNRYMKIEMNESAEINATMAWDIDDEDLAGLNRTTLRFAFHNGSTNTWQHVEQNWQEGNMVYCNTTHFSMWTITGELSSNPTPGTPYQAGNGTKFQLQAGERYQLRLQSGFQLNMSADGNGNMSMTEYQNNPAGAMEQNRKQLGFFWNLSFEGTGEFQATLEWKFQNSDIAGLKDNSLKFAFYNESSGAWQYGEQNWIDGNTLYCNTTHFSTWTVIGEEETQSAPGFEIALSLIALAVLVTPSRRRK